MNRYATYKDSGIPWLGEVPEHWEIKHSNKIFKIHNGATPKTSEPDYWGDEIAWFTPKDLGDNKNKEIAVSLKMITKEGYENCGVSLAPAKSIALSKRAPIGHLAITLLPAVVNQGCFLLEVLSPNDVNYLYYWLHANKSTLNSFGQGSTFMELPREKFAMLKISIPSEKEQTAIAHYLDTKLGEIDALIGKQQTLLEKLAEQRTAVITHAVTKGLNPAAPMKNSGVEWLGDVPAHWSIIQFRRVVENIKDGTHGTHSRENNGFPLLSAKNVFNDGIHIHDNESQISEEDYKLITSNGFPKKNDLLITCVGSIGRCCIYPFDTPFAFQRSVAFLRLNKNAVPQFYKYFVESNCYQEQLKANVKLSIQGGVYLGTLISMYAILPTKEEQTSIAGYLNQETAKIDRLCETVNQTIGRLKEYRTALITQAVTGKIKVTDE